MNYSVQEHGFTVARGAIEASVREELLSALGTIDGAGRRGVLSMPVIAALARSARLLDLVRPHLCHEPVPVRAIYFDKSSEKNWLVAWHQDLTIALKKRVNTPGFGPWSIKDSIPHVQPPVEFLEQMLTIRLHLDEADESNGALRVLPGSHGLGRMSANQIQKLRIERAEILCAAATGDILLMRPLLLHASSRSTSAKHRRILHIEYAGFQLPPMLQWHEAA